MSGLQDFLAPFSHLLFANRNIVIVLLCAVAFWAAVQALMDRWRADRLERDLNTARSNESVSPAGRRYTNAPALEHAPMETNGALPPIKGGRTYARNLGSALQKAGMSGPQIYSPPTPAGFAPNANQMPVGQPGQPAPYATPNVPWTTPAGPPPAPWAFPAAGRSAPAPAPFYQPQPQAPPASTPVAPMPVQGPPPPPYPSASPSPAFIPPQPAPFAPPAPMAAGAQAPSYPTYVPTTPPGGAPPMGAAGPVPSMAPPPAEADASEGRRGKPKRRRFNFNVLENLEKMVQPKAAEPVPTPPAPIPPAPVQASFTGTVAPTATPEAAPPTTPSVPPPAEPMLPFLFGKRGAEAKAPEPPAIIAPVVPSAQPPIAEEKVEEKAAESEKEEEKAEEKAAESDLSAPEEIEAVAPPEVGAPEEPVLPPEPKVEAHRSMRSMMFGEEIVAAASANVEETETGEAQADREGADSAEVGETHAESGDRAEVAADSEAEAASAEEPQTSDDSTWPSYPWTRSEETSSSAEAEATASADESHAESTPEPAAAESGSAFGTYETWKASQSFEPESEPAVTDHDGWNVDGEPHADTEDAPVHTEEQAATPEPVEAAASSETPEPPAASPADDRPGAGTLVIIEDDQTAASYYATLFRGNGYRVEVANDGVSGVDLCTKVQPQVILLDVMMPRQNGILVLQTLRASDETKNTPVVVMSNFSEPTLIKRALQLGALEYVIKTQVEGPALLTALPRWMNREKAFAAA